MNEWARVGRNPAGLDVRVRGRERLAHVRAARYTNWKRNAKRFPFVSNGNRFSGGTQRHCVPARISADVPDGKAPRYYSDDRGARG